jgi:hypothetical protein
MNGAKIIDSWAIEKLWNDFESNRIRNENNADEYYRTEEELKKRYKELYYKNETFEDLNDRVVKIMIKLNLRLRVIPLHNFGSKMKID